MPANTAAPGALSLRSPGNSSDGLATSRRPLSAARLEMISLTSHAALRRAKSRWLNRSPGARSLRGTLAEQGSDPTALPDTFGRWQPFTPEQSARLRENYADDLHWLTAGADGLATLTEDPTRQRAGTSLPAGHMTRGHNYDNGQGHMAQSG